MGSKHDPIFVFVARSAIYRVTVTTYIPPKCVKGGGCTSGEHWGTIGYMGEVKSSTKLTCTAKTLMET